MRPSRPKIFHITHADNLPSILFDGAVVSDAIVASRGGPAATVGMSTIKARRLQLPVACHPGLTVGACVPFYFCPRSVMLYLIYRANHPELAYRGGQGPIVHLEADLHDVVAWANANHRRWAFTTSNAGAFYATSRSDLAELDQIDWAAVAATDFRDAAVKEGKQAEFLIDTEFPWRLVERIGVHTAGVRGRVYTLLTSSAHQPPVEVRPDWYY